MPFGSLNTNNRLIYTRRVGGTTDDDSGEAGRRHRGGQAQRQPGRAELRRVRRDRGRRRSGRDFYALRTSPRRRHPGPRRDGHPRRAPCFATRSRWTARSRASSARPTSTRSITAGRPNPQLVDPHHAGGVGRRPDGPGRQCRRHRQHVRAGSDTGGQMRIDWDMGEGWRQQLYMLHLGDNLQLNDFGFLERNNFNYARYDLAQALHRPAGDLAVQRDRLARAVSRRMQRPGPAHRRRGRDQPQRPAARRRQRFLRDRDLDVRATTT